jgi:hypothetical protein
MGEIGGCVWAGSGVLLVRGMQVIIRTCPHWFEQDLLLPAGGRDGYHRRLLAPIQPMARVLATVAAARSRFG